MGLLSVWQATESGGLYVVIITYFFMLCRTEHLYLSSYLLRLLLCQVTDLSEGPILSSDKVNVVKKYVAVLQLSAHVYFWLQM